MNQATDSGSGEDFEHATRVRGGGGTYQATLSPAWEIWGPNGGYMATIALRAAGAEAKIPSPVSFYAQFLRVARFDTIEARVTVVQSGRRSESIRVSLVQDGKAVLEGLLRTALPGEGLEHTAFTAPQIPPPEALPRAEDLRGADSPAYRFWQNIEQRVPRTDYFTAERASLSPHLVEWYRFRPSATFDDPFVDAGRSLLLIDTMGWPAVWLKHPKPRFQAPNLDVVAFFHADARDSEWLLCEQECPLGQGGLLGTRARVFDRQGRLVASGGAQLLCLPAQSRS